jgi:rhodanese-related sulfurtransferase
MKMIIFFLIALFSIQCKPDTATVKTVEPVEEVQPTIKIVDVEGAKKLIAEHPQLIVIDVRTPEEHAEGALPNALNVDVKNDNFEEEINKYDKSAEYLMHCRSGSRSMLASEIMIKNGFKNVTNMDGGYLAWKDSGN